MKIVVDATAAISGGKLYLNQLLPQWARLADGHEIIIFHWGDFDQFALPESRARFCFHRVRLPWAAKGASASILRMLWRVFVLPFHLRRLRPQLFFSNAGSLPGWKPRATKSVIALHNCMPLCQELIAEESTVLRWRLRMLRRFMGRSVQRADAAIVFSMDMKNRLVDSFGPLAHEPEVVFHGVDWGAEERRISLDENALTRLGVNRPYLLYVSQFHRYKNLLRLLEAFAVLAAKHPQLSLVLVGAAADPHYWREVEDALTRLSLRERVIHLAHCPREQLINLYLGAQVFVQPSLSESCSFPLLEALALGVPVAAARATALPEMAGNGASYFDPYQPADIAAVVERLLWDEDWRGELRQHAIAQAAKFSWAETARRTLRVCERVGREPQA